MERKNADIDILLSALIVFSIIIGLLHSSWLMAEEVQPVQEAVQVVQEPDEIKIEIAAPATTTPPPIAEISTKEAIELLQPLLESESVEKMVEKLAGIPLDKIVPILEHILGNKEQYLSRSSRIELLFGIANSYTALAEKNRILDFIVDSRYLYLREGNPIIYIAAMSSYPQIIPVVKEWYGKRVSQQFNRDVLRAKLESKALTYAVEQKSLEALKAMKRFGLMKSKKNVSILLHDAVRTQAGRDIVEYLLDSDADIDYALDGYTPLIRAVENNDLDTVQLLIERGADRDKIADDAIGNAMQIAASKELVAIEEYLSEYGVNATSTE